MLDEGTKFYVVRSKPYAQPFLVYASSMQEAMTKIFAASSPSNIQIEEVIDISDPPITDLVNGEKEHVA